MGWREAVEAARAVENKEVAALVLADKGLQKLCAAWHLARVAVPDEFADAGLDAVLGGMVVDAKHLETLTGLQGMLVLKALERARALRLVYPDGTIHGMAKMVLQKQIKDALAG